MIEELERLLSMLTPQEAEDARRLAMDGGVTRLPPEGPTLLFAVDDRPRRVVRLLPGSTVQGRCVCGDLPCRHLAAALLWADQAGDLRLAKAHREMENAQRLLSFCQPLTQRETLRLEVTLRLIRMGEVSVSLRVGLRRLYAVRSMLDFLQAVEREASYDFSPRFAYTPDEMAFSEKDRRLLSMLFLHAQAAAAQGGLPRSGAAARFLSLSDAACSDLLEALTAMPYRLLCEEKTFDLIGIAEGRIALCFSAGLSGRDLVVAARAPLSLVPLTRDRRFVFCEGEMLRIPEEQRRVLLAMAENNAVFRVSGADIPVFMAEALPLLRRAGECAIEGPLADRMERHPLRAQVRLDLADDGIRCQVLFTYGEHDIDPFVRQAPRPSPIFLLRDAEGEAKVLDLLASYGFFMRGGEVLLEGDEALWRFFNEGIAALQSCAEVWCSDALMRMRPRRPKLSGTLRMQGGMLHLLLQEEDEPTNEELSILHALREKRTWFRLKDGSFLDLTQLAPWQGLAEAVASQEDASLRDEAEIAAYRAAYLLRLLEDNHLPISVDDETKAHAAAILTPKDAACPSALLPLMRPYQQKGFAWLSNLTHLRMGGILADDMGLGKTLQLIALLVSLQEAGSGPSIVVAPSSLLYNWAAEIARFAPSLAVCVAEGSRQQRAESIHSLREEPASIDVYLTSYPLLRKDIDLLASVHFRVAVLDEAQQVKNALSAGAEAVRQIDAQARFALTGTPMENHPGELWSLFDFALPGYLGSFASFMRHYGEGENAEALRRRVRPFLLRRLKRDVLSEIPEKTETALIAEMTEAQRRVYRASLHRFTQQESGLIGANRIRALTALTELRQICCHPSLVLPDYAGSSGKLDLLMDFLPGALEAGHRVLIFSQFTRMLRMIERRLLAAGIDSLYLDGETPVRERLTRVNRFNEGEGRVFLISLKAGGAGLNLVGADTVVHFDPWWNPAAEDQATDRAHRIGQRRPVAVYRLITRNSVEEQVVRLGERKRELFDRLIQAGEALPASLTQEEILSLFQEET